MLPPGKLAASAAKCVMSFRKRLVKEVTRARVQRHFRGTVHRVDRFELPNLHALNFLLHGALDGGGTISLKTDAQGKVYSTALLRMEIPVPLAVARKVAPSR